MNWVIRAVLNALFFSRKRFYTHKKPKKVQKAQKMQISK